MKNRYLDFYYSWVLICAMPILRHANSAGWHPTPAATRLKSIACDQNHGHCLSS